MSIRSPVIGIQLFTSHYRGRAAAIPGLIVCGRLGAYRYFDMDQAIGHAMTFATKLLEPATQLTRANAAVGAGW
ncbi:hypothetical protein SBV1_960068 [Verrucomicrobia bacterium]|nr:hypothetical protein SBV1_960068 [Verrucomicrobiota bacterium]